jgi:hypothetical protein
MILKFQCGCMFVAWEGEKTALVCCIKHEAPHQQIKNILPLELIEIRFEGDFQDKVEKCPE